MDGLHAAVTPLFLGDDQTFVSGADMKSDLRDLAVRYAQLPPEERAKGAMTYAAYPPRDSNCLTSRLWDQFLPGWRVHADNPITITPELNDRIIKQLAPMIDAIEQATGKPKGQPHILAARGMLKKEST
jgi:hypothetical protein